VKKPTLVSLFGGIGGIDLAFERAGFETMAVVELDADCRALLKSQFPEAKILRDVRITGGAQTVMARALKARKIAIAEYYETPPHKRNLKNYPTPLWALREAIEHTLGMCDVLSAGWPCQDLSVAGLRAGLAGSRSGLFYEFTRIAYELCPSFLVWENVPGLLSSDHGRDMLRVVAEFQRIRYSGGWRTLDAQYFGVAQRRRRVIGVFARHDLGTAGCAEVLSLQEGMRGHPAPRRETGKAVAGTFTARARAGGGLGSDFEMDGGLQVTGTLTKSAISGGGPGGGDGKDSFLIPSVECASVAPTLYAKFGQKLGLEDQRIDGGAGLFIVEKPTAFDTTQITSPGNYSNPKPGDPCHTLNSAGHVPTITHTLRAEGHDASEDGTSRGVPIIAATMRSNGEAHSGFGEAEGLIAFPQNMSSTQSATEENLAPNFQAKNPTAIAFDLRGSEGGAQLEGPHDTANLRAAEGGSSRSYVFNIGAFNSEAMLGDNPVSGFRETEIARVLQSNGNNPSCNQGGNAVVKPAMGVRRLTPRECERLQGFPDDYTSGFSDSTRYRMLGNSVCVYKFEWIGRRLMRIGFPDFHRKLTKAGKAKK